MLRFIRLAKSLAFSIGIHVLLVAFLLFSFNWSKVVDEGDEVQPIQAVAVDAAVLEAERKRKEEAEQKRVAEQQRKVEEEQKRIADEKRKAERRNKNGLQKSNAK